MNKLAAKLDMSPSEVVRRALVRYHNDVLGMEGTVRRKRVAAAERLLALCEGLDPEGEVRGLKLEDRFS